MSSPSPVVSFFVCSVCSAVSGVSFSCIPRQLPQLMITKNLKSFLVMQGRSQIIWQQIFDGTIVRSHRKPLLNYLPNFHHEKPTNLMFQTQMLPLVLMVMRWQLINIYWTVKWHDVFVINYLVLTCMFPYFDDYGVFCDLLIWIALFAEAWWASVIWCSYNPTTSDSSDRKPTSDWTFEWRDTFNSKGQMVPSSGRHLEVISQLCGQSD